MTEVHPIRSAKLNLKNDLLRRRFDSLKYDIKKVEEGEIRPPRYRVSS